MVSVVWTGKYVSPGLRHSDPPGAVVGGPTTTSVFAIVAPSLSGRLPRLFFWFCTAVASKFWVTELPRTT
jgi:hypothetical protein